MSSVHVRFIHKINPRAGDVMESVSIPDNAFSDRLKLGAALRKAGVLDPGARVRTFRVEGNRVVVFPTMPGLTTYWHSIILTFRDRRPNPSMAEIKAHAGRAGRATADAVRRGYAHAKPHAKRAAAATADAARRGYAYAKPRVKAGARWSLSKVSDYAGRGARALERDNPGRKERAGLSGYPSFDRDGGVAKEYVGAFGVMKDPLGNVIGPARITARWKTPRPYVSSHQFQIEVETPHGTYTGRGAGHGMLWNGTLKSTAR